VSERYGKMREWLIKLRKKANKTQEQVADLARISRPTYTRIETGERNPSVDIAKKIALVLEFDWVRFYESEVKENERI